MPGYDRVISGKQYEVPKRKKCGPARHEPLDFALKHLADHCGEPQGCAPDNNQQARLRYEDKAGNRDGAHQDKETFQEASPLLRGYGYAINHRSENICSSCEVGGGGKVPLHYVGHLWARRAWHSGQRVRQSDDGPSGERLLNEKSCLGDLYQFVKWDG